MILYTDGLVEGRSAPGARERFGLERLRTWFSERGTQAIDDDTLERLIAHLEDANGGILPDDVAVLVLGRLSAAA